jgi:hypothetical protein
MCETKSDGLLHTPSKFSMVHLIAFEKVIERYELSDTNNGGASGGD